MPPYNLFGLESQDYVSAKVVVLPVPYDSTASYKAGAREGPHAIIQASRNIELYSEELGTDISEIGIYTLDELEPDVNSAEGMVNRIEKEVPTGARIGIAVKGAEYSEIDKGTFISSERIEARKEAHAKITFSNFYDASTGSFEAVLVSGFSKSNVSAVKEGDSWKLILAKAIPFRKDSRFMLFRETQPRIFGVGTFQ